MGIFYRWKYNLEENKMKVLWIRMDWLFNDSLQQFV